MKLKLIEYIDNHLPQDFSPYYIYSIRVDDCEVGRIVYREGSEQERYLDGHIGYSVFEEYRGHNYAYQACLLLKEIIEKDSVIITCGPENKASQRIIEKLGCQYIETKTIPARLKKLFTSQEKEKMIYKWDLTS